MGSAVDKRRKIYSLDSAAVSKGIVADVFWRRGGGWMSCVVPPDASGAGETRGRRISRGELHYVKSTNGVGPSNCSE